MKLVRFGHIVDKLDEDLRLDLQPEMTRRRFLKWAFSGSLALAGGGALLNLLRVEDSWADRFGGTVDVQVPLIYDSFWSGFSSSHSTYMTNRVKESITGFPLSNRPQFDHFLRCWAENAVEKIDPELLLKLAKEDYLIRKYGFKTPILITSGFRTSQHNSQVAGATGSKHVLGIAVDQFVEGLTPNALAWAAYQSGFTWVGISTGEHGNFCHADVRHQNHQTVFFYN